MKDTVCRAPQAAVEMLETHAIIAREAQAEPERKAFYASIEMVLGTGAH
jgi:hypothetical protein